MQKFLVGMALIIAVGTLLLGGPYIHQRFLVTNETAAASLNELSVIDLGPQLIDCINVVNQPGKWWGEVEEWELTAHPDMGGPWSNEYYLISGLIGWHVTWQAAVPLNTKPIAAYDMHRIGAGSMWSEEIPSHMITALEQCGVDYRGAWQGEAPLGFE